ncbi:acetate/propionate family kinase [Salinisphaera hydrothermalis]|uniref:Acetate kinase n=1 Tax=Salinisphaera hydrothermalis (strain C41B8) TaxID=1304275 RepID=A0A084IHX1_SALHC|nr:acetate/propionate family kinase [Salinisphaera hydrothermalis]KEZ76305.1 acetate kinase [Salinisphaera hydrothermalis C41B8]
MSVLVINAGSSSLKIALFSEDASGAGLRRSLRAFVDYHDAPTRLCLWSDDDRLLDEQTLPDGPERLTAALARVLSECDRCLAGDPLVAVGHRVVHGGADFAAPVRIDAAHLYALEALTPLAPQHQPHNLAGVHVIEQLRPGVAQVACFDTAFHRSQPRLAQRFALPRDSFDAGLRRYGFHGLSYEYVAGRLAKLDPAAAGGRVVVAHLGHGASLCALSNGRSIATSMGFSTLDGLMMGTRCGALDPGVLLYWLQQAGRTVAEVADTLYNRSGLLGVSGLSDDMRVLLASDTPAAAEAVALFVYRCVQEIGAMVAVLGGLDALVFTGGIGEHAAPIRERIVEAVAWLGLVLDTDANAVDARCISTVESRARAWVIPTDEELQIAMHCRRLG